MYGQNETYFFVLKQNIILMLEQVIMLNFNAVSSQTGSGWIYFITINILYYDHHHKFFLSDWLSCNRSSVYEAW